jgi:protein-S-isoprenylcysteine O-methyltransferase
MCGMPLPNWLAIAGIWLWAGYEVLLRRRADRQTTDWKGGREDRSSTRLLFAAYAAAIVLSISLHASGVGSVPTALTWVGVVMLAAGLALRAWGMAVLGRYYTRTLRVVDEQQVVRGGPYRLIRHPGYAGSLLVWTGYCLGIGNWIAFVIVAALMLLAYTWRITSEETMLVDHFGDAYRDYQTSTARLIPFLY